MAVAKAISTNGSFIIWSGTYAEVIQALEDEKVPESMIKGMCYQGNEGSCAVLVKRH